MPPALDFTSCIIDVFSRAMLAVRSEKRRLEGVVVLSFKDIAIANCLFGSLRHTQNGVENVLIVTVIYASEANMLSCDGS